MKDKSKALQTSKTSETSGTLSKAATFESGDPEEDKEKGHKKILEEIIVENFPKMGKDIITQVQETQRVPNRINPRQNTTKHILIKVTKIKHKEQILKAAKEKRI